MSTSISYNVLNLPQTVRFADGHETRYTYDADGRELRVGGNPATPTGLAWVGRTTMQ